MSKVTRTWSGPSMHAIAGMFYARASVTPKRVLRSLRNTQKVLTTVRQIARANSGCATDRSPIKMRNISIADATRRMSATELVCAAPSQQRLRRSSAARRVCDGADAARRHTIIKYHEQHINIMTISNVSSLFTSRQFYK